MATITTFEDPLLQIVGTCEKRLFGVTPAERLARQRGKKPGPMLIADASAVLSDAAVAWLLENPGTVLTSPSKRPMAVAAEEAAVGEALEAFHAQGPGTARVDPSSMPDMFVRKLRRRDKLLVRSLDEQPGGKIERELFDNVYKGITDLVTKYVWPVPAYWVTQVCARLGLTPNMVTSVGIVAMALAAYLWWEGELAWGLAFAWFMTFLDTVDGKLARVTARSSKLGDKLDHYTDVVHPPIWWGCLAVGLTEGAGAADREAVWISCAIIIATYAIGRAFEMMFKVRIGYNPFLWRPFDSFFRLIISRRNIILLIMTIALLFGAAHEGFIISAVWSVISVVIQGVRYVQAVSAAKRGPVQSWLM